MGEPGRHWQDTLFMNPKPANAEDLSHRDPPNIDYKYPDSKPRVFMLQPRLDASIPPRPRHPPFERRIAHVPLRSPPQRNPDVIARAEPWVDVFHASMPQNMERPTRRDVMSGVREILSADLLGGLVGRLYGDVYKHTAYNFMNYSLENYGTLVPEESTTIELREAGGTLDPAWICEEGGHYDIVDFLVDLNLLAEARYCEERLERGAEAWFECLLFAPTSEERAENKRREREEQTHLRQDGSPGSASSMYASPA
ncbi:DASH complex subunit DAD1 [Verticillium dahliae VDG1]|nr:DASH complex subunit DAD1 [Verticillium dahliae VDG1]